jgi:hypothetical protein
MASNKTLPAVSGSCDVDDIAWCYANLDHPEVRREDAPSAGAWNLLLWAREARNRFYGSVLPRTFEVHVPFGGEPDDADDYFTPDEVAKLRQFDRFRYWLLARGAPEHLILDAEETVCFWDAATGCQLSVEGMMALTAGIAFAVGAAVETAKRRPEAFERYLDELEDLHEDSDPRGDPAPAESFTAPAAFIDGRR